MPWFSSKTSRPWTSWTSAPRSDTTITSRQPEPTSTLPQVLDKNTMLLRTYERGVEAETYACGTGAAATQLLASTLGLTDEFANLTTTGNEVLTIFLENGNVFLQGAAELTFKGELYLGPLGLSL